MSKLIHGVGYNSKTKYPTSENGRISTAYSQWHGMIERCYDIKRSKKNKSYIDCDVSSEWHDFQNFAEWFYNQDYNDMGYELDKDLLAKGNRVYGPENCRLVPRELNILLLNRQSHRGAYPQGVDFNKASGKFRARVKNNGKSKSLGYFDCPNKAYQAYKLAKERYVKNTALAWANRVDWDVFLALMNWTLDSSNNEPR